MKKNRTATRVLLLLLIMGGLFFIIDSLYADEYDPDNTFKFKELGNDVWLSLSKNLSARVGFKQTGAASLEDTRESTRSFSPFSALLNWHLFDNNFYLSMGAVQAEDPDIKSRPELDTPASMTLFSWDSQNEISDQPLNFDMNRNEPYLGFGFSNPLNTRMNSFFFLDFGILHYSEMKDQNSSLYGKRGFFEKLQSISLSDEEKDNSSRYKPLFKMGLSLKY